MSNVIQRFAVYMIVFIIMIYSSFLLSMIISSNTHKLFGCEHQTPKYIPNWWWCTIPHIVFVTCSSIFILFVLSYVISKFYDRFIKYKRNDENK